MTTTIQGNNNANLFSTAVVTAGENFNISTTNDVDIIALEGNDTVNIANNNLVSNASVRGAAGNDSVLLGNGGVLNSDIFTGLGNDTVIASGGTITNSIVQDLYGNNTYQLSALNLSDIQTREGDDSITIAGAVAFSTIRAGLGADSLTFSGAINDTSVASGRGNDTLVFNAGATLLRTTVQSEYDNNNITTNGLITSSSILTGTGADTISLVGGATNSLVRTAASNDSIVIGGALTGASIFAGDGNDTVTLNAGATNTQITSLSGENRFVISTGAIANATTGTTFSGSTDTRMVFGAITDVQGAAFFGSNVINTVTKVSNLGAGAIDLGNGAANAGINAYARGIREAIATDATNSTITFDGGVGNSITITGGSSNDTLTAGAGNDVVTGGGANNSLSGAGGNDTITGGSANDTIRGGTGTDSLSGAGSDDIFIYASTAEMIVANALGDTISGGTGANTIQAEGAITIAAGDSFANATDIQTLQQTGGTASNIAFNSDARLSSIRTIDLDFANLNNTVNLTGVTVSTSVITGGGTDNLTGGSGADSLTSGAGNDTVAGAGGVDVITFAGGTNRLVTPTTATAANRDTVTGFVVGTDVLGLVAANTEVATAVGNQAVVEDEAVAAANANGTAYDLAAVVANLNTLDLVTLDTTVLANIANANLANATDGTELLKALVVAGAGNSASGITVDAATNAFYLATDDGANGYLYYVAAQNDTNVVASEIALVGTFNATAIDGIVAAQTIMV